MENMIKIENLTVKYGTQNIIKSIDVEIESGEFVSIIGPNGAGKSTLLKAVMKNLDVSSGEIYLKGKNLKNVSHREKSKIIGFVPQDYNISFDFSVYDIVEMGRNPHKERFKKSEFDDKQIIEDALTKTNTIEFKDKNFNNLSGGEKQRVIIARALAQQPEILILDEATSNLDIHHQLDILELIHSLNREEGITVLTIMHDLNLASRFSDKIILLNEGMVSKVGTPDEVIDEKVLRTIYDMEMIVRENKLLLFKEILPMRTRKAKIDKTIKIHIICGGGTGEYIIQKLYSERYILSCGILNEGDSDFLLCKNLDIRCVFEKPFSVFSEEKIEENRQLVKDSDIILLTDIAVGSGNFINVKMIEDIDDKQILILHSVDRDFVDGEYEILIKKLIKKENVKYVMNLKELFECLK